MHRLIGDTHAIVWYLTAPQKIGVAARRQEDPMDRLVVAAARATRSAVLSIDDALDGFGVRRVWD